MIIEISYTCEFQLNISTFVTVKDVNDNAPEFDKDEYFISIPEELPEGTPIALEFEATDNDQEGPNSFIRYRIVGADSDEDIDTGEGGGAGNGVTSSFGLSNPKMKQLLKIPDPYKPQIVVGGRIDFEKIRRFEVEIEAEDGGQPPLKSRAKLVAVVLDMDDLNPTFQHENYYTNSIQVCISYKMETLCFLKVHLMPLSNGIGCQEKNVCVLIYWKNLGFNFRSISGSHFCQRRGYSEWPSLLWNHGRICRFLLHQWLRNRPIGEAKCYLHDFIYSRKLWSPNKTIIC